MPHTFQGQPVLSVTEAAEILDVSAFVIRRMIRDKELPTLRFGHCFHVLEAGVRAERARLDRELAEALASLEGVADASQ